MHRVRTFITGAVVVLTLAVGTLGLTMGGTSAGAATSDTYFSCFRFYSSGIISTQSPVVTPQTAGMSNEIVSWIPEYLAYNSATRQWVHYQWGKWASKSLYGYGGAMSWYYTDGSGLADYQKTLAVSGKFAVKNWVYHSATGQYEVSKGWNEQYLLHPEQGGGSTWCAI
jgi:hypothetical protein